MYLNAKHGAHSRGLLSTRSGSPSRATAAQMAAEIERTGPPSGSPQKTQRIQTAYSQCLGIITGDWASPDPALRHAQHFKFAPLARVLTLARTSGYGFA